MSNFKRLFSGSNSLAEQGATERQVGIYENTLSFKTQDKCSFNFDSLMESLIASTSVFDEDVKNATQSVYLGGLDKTPDITMEGAKDIAKSAVDFFKRILTKFKEFMKKFYMYMYSHLGSFDQFMKKYSKELNATKPDFYFQGYEFDTKQSFPKLMEVESLIADFNSGLSKITSASIKEEETKLAEKTSTDNSDKIRGSILGIASVDKGDFTKTTQKMLRGDQEDTKEIHVDASYLKRCVVAYDTLKARLKDYQKEEKKINEMINAIIRIFSNGPKVELGSSGERVYKARSVSQNDGKTTEDKDNSTSYDINESNATLVNKYYTIMYSRLNEFSSLILTAMSEKVKAVRDELKQTEKVIRRSVMAKTNKDDKKSSMECGLVQSLPGRNMKSSSIVMGVYDEQDINSQIDYLSTDIPPEPPAVDGSEENKLFNRTHNNFSPEHFETDQFTMISPMDYGGTSAGTMLDLQLDRSMEAMFDAFESVDNTLARLGSPQSVLEAGVVRTVASGAKNGVQKTKDFFRKIFEFIKNILARFKEKVKSLQGNIKWVSERKDQFEKLNYDNINVELVPYWKGNVFGTADQFVATVKINNVLNMNNKDEVARLSNREHFIEDVLNKYKPRNGELVDGLKDLMRVGDINGSDSVKLSGSGLKTIVLKQMIPGVIDYNDTVKGLDDLDRKVDTELKIIEREMTKREMEVDKSVTESSIGIINTIFESLGHILPVPLLEAEVSVKSNTDGNTGDEGTQEEKNNAKTSSNTKENKKVEVSVVDKDKAEQEKAQTNLYSNKENDELKMMRNVVHFQQLALTTTMTITEERNVVYNNTLRSIWNELNTIGKKQSNAEKQVEKDKTKK